MNAHSFFHKQSSCKQSRHSTKPSASDSTRTNSCKGQCLEFPLTSQLRSMQQLSSATRQTELQIYLRQVAHTKAQQGDYADAIKILTQLIRQNSVSANDYNNRGLVYFQSGQLDKAIADYNKAIQLNPNLAGAYNNRANYYAAQGRLAEAIADYDKTIDLNPVHIRARINQGITYRDMGLYDLAIENFDFALRLGWLEEHIFAERGRTYHLNGDWNLAIADYQRALKRLPQPSQSNAGSAVRLRQQVETWFNELLSPLQS